MMKYYYVQGLCSQRSALGLKEIVKIISFFATNETMTNIICLFTIHNQKKTLMLDDFHYEKKNFLFFTE